LAVLSNDNQSSGKVSSRRCARPPAIALAFGQKKDIAPTLATLMPDVPTWWVPESLAGGFLPVLMIVVGALIVVTGRRFKRMLGAL
jgi:hypothetical protein